MMKFHRKMFVLICGLSQLIFSETNIDLSKKDTAEHKTNHNSKFITENLPKELSPIQINYPYWAQEYGVEAKVTVMVNLDSSGNVINLKINESADDDFDNSAINALKGAKFTAYRENGKSIAVHFLRIFDFKMETHAPRFAMPDPPIGFIETFPNGKKGKWNGEMWIAIR